MVGFFLAVRLPRPFRRRLPALRALIVRSRRQSVAVPARSGSTRCKVPASAAVPPPLPTDNIPDRSARHHCRRPQTGRREASPSDATGARHRKRPSENIRVCSATAPAKPSPL